MNNNLLYNLPCRRGEKETLNFALIVETFKKCGVNVFASACDLVELEERYADFLKKQDEYEKTIIRLKQEIFNLKQVHRRKNATIHKLCSQLTELENSKEQDSYIERKRAEAREYQRKYRQLNPDYYKKAYAIKKAKKELKQLEAQS